MTSDQNHAPEPPREVFVRPADRYGPPGRPMPRWLPFALVGVAVVAVVPLTVSVYDRLNPPSEAQLVGWTVESEHEVSVRVNVRKPADDDVSCEVWALDATGERVGSARVELTGDRTSGVVERRFPTSSGTAAVETGRCSVDDR